MIVAPVGFQCPDCVRAAAPPQPTTVAGGRLITKPFVTYTLIGINLAMFAIQFLVGIDEIAKTLGMWPIGIALGGEWWRLATAAFLHGDPLHLAFNMFALFVLGRSLEMSLGHLHFLVLYGMAGFGGAVLSFSLSDPRVTVVGASGAIFGLLGALIVLGLRHQNQIVPVLVLLGLLLAIGFVRPNTDWLGHIGGLVTGALVAAIMVLPKRGHRTLVQVFGLCSLGIALAAVAAWRTADLIQTYGPFVELT